MATLYIEQIARILGYTVNKITSGKHIQASTPHYHIMFQLCTNEKKTFKILNEKLISLGTQINFPSKLIADLFRDTDKKISFVYEGTPKRFKKKTIYYGEEAMRYPFKEYNRNEQIELKLQFGFTESELYSMREYSHTEWKAVKKKQSDQALAQIAQKEKFESQTTFLREKMHSYPTHDVDTTIKYVMKQIWIYSKYLYKANRLEKIQASQVWNTAVNFLVMEDYIDEDEIINRSSQFKFN